MLVISRQIDQSLTKTLERVREHCSAQIAEALSPLQEVFGLPARRVTVEPERFYDELAERVRQQDFTSIGALAIEYKPELMAIGKLRTNSSDSSAKRRLQEVLGDHVYGIRVPDSELPTLVHEGRTTGGSRLRA